MARALYTLLLFLICHLSFVSFSYKDQCICPKQKASKYGEITG